MEAKSHIDQMVAQIREEEKGGVEKRMGREEKRGEGKIIEIIREEKRDEQRRANQRP